MLSKQRINEAEVNFRGYLSQGLIDKSKFDSLIYNILIKNSEDSVETAIFLSNNKKSDLWVIVSSYYSMFYLANAVIYKLGYKIGDRISHKITNDALIVLVRDKLAKNLLEDYEELKDEALLLAKNKADEIVSDFEFERKKRGFIQYQTKEVEKASKAETSLKRAKQFLFEMNSLLDSLNVKQL